MRSFVYAAVALVSAVAVQANTPLGLPDCTSKCIDSTYGGCGSLDVKCICANTKWIAGLACCISTACDTADQETTIQFADKLCAANGVSNLPSAATCAAGQTPSYISGASATSAGSSASSTNSASTTSAPSSGASSSTATGTTTGATAASNSATSSSASASHTGSANKVEAAAFGVGAVVFGALAAL